jgi:nucleotide-binding universal stress UspA family protein
VASRVVIGYDGSEASEDAVAFGLTWSRSTGDVPIVATVYPEEHPFGLGVRRVDIDWVTYVGEQAEIIQDKVRAAVGDAALYRNIASTSASHGLILPRTSRRSW